MWRRAPSLRERFRVAGPDCLSDAELLELLIDRGSGRVNGGAVAERLIGRFGDLHDIAHAPSSALLSVTGVDAETVMRFRLVAIAAVKLAGTIPVKRTSLGTPARIKSYLANAPPTRTDYVRVLFLDKRHDLIADEVIARPTPKMVVRRCLKWTPFLGARA
jgi:DNA repair protein RadC